MTRVFWLILILSLNGCAASVTSPAAGITDSSSARALIPLNKLQSGMTQEDVLLILGQKVTIGYEFDLKRPGATSISLENPHRKETFHGKEKSYETVYYFTHIRHPDDQITDDECTPLVFEGGKLIGWGWPFWEQLKKKSVL